MLPRDHRAGGPAMARPTSLPCLHQARPASYGDMRHRRRPGPECRTCLGDRTNCSHSWPFRPQNEVRRSAVQHDVTTIWKIVAFDFRFDLCWCESVTTPSCNKPSPQDMLGRIDRYGNVEHGVQAGPRLLVQQQVVAFHDQHANGVWYQSRARARDLKITVENRDRNLVVLIAPESIKHVEQAKNVKGLGSALARS